MDIYDQATLREEEQREAALAAMQEQVQAALQHEGTVDCIDCGEPIGAARKQAQPTACRCIDCQTLWETTKCR